MRTLTFQVIVRIGDGPTPPGVGSRREDVSADAIGDAILEGAERFLDRTEGESAEVKLVQEQET